MDVLFPGIGEIIGGSQRFAEEQKQKPEKDRAKEGLIEKLENVIKKRFMRVSYSEAIEILLNSKENKKGKFQFPVTIMGRRFTIRTRALFGRKTLRVSSSFI